MNDVSAVLAELHDAYVAKVNRAVSQGQDDLVAELTDEFTEVSLRTVLAAGRACA